MILNSGKLFDSSIIMPNAKYSIPASKLGKGEHPFYCYNSSLHAWKNNYILISSVNNFIYLYLFCIIINKLIY